MKIPGIYKITNSITGDYYIGSSVDCGKRWRQHTQGLSRGDHGNSRLQRAWNKYGAEAFSFSIVEMVENTGDLTRREQSWLNKVEDSEKLYNLCLLVASSVLGVKRSAESRAKMSKAQLGKKRDPASIARSAEGNRGRVFSDETKAKIGAGNKGKVRSEETKRKLAEAWERRRERGISEETRVKMSAASKARKPTPEAIAKRTATMARNKALKEQTQHG